jgi:hypothetical protein
MASLLETQPATDPGKLRYHALTFGWLCDALIRRVDGRTTGRMFEEEFEAPLDLDIWIWRTTSRRRPNRMDALPHLERRPWRRGADRNPRVDRVAKPPACGHRTPAREPSTMASSRNPRRQRGRDRSLDGPLLRHPAGRRNRPQPPQPADAPNRNPSARSRERTDHRQADGLRHRIPTSSLSPTISGPSTTPSDTPVPADRCTAQIQFRGSRSPT